MATTHLIKALRGPDGWILVYMDERTVVGEEKPYTFRTRREAYEYAEKSWPANSTWQGRRVHGGYRITVVI